MTRFLMPSRECRGMELPNIAGNPSGLKFHARDGIVRVRDRDTAAYFKAAFSEGGDGGIVAVADANFAGSDGEELVCPRCSMRNWPWVSQCGRCGYDLSKEPAA